MSDQVEYREIPGFPGYRVGGDGTIWTCKRSGRTQQRFAEWRLMRLRQDSYGYYAVMLRNPGSKRQFRVHELVLLAFVGPRPEGMECRHLDDQRQNNCRANLAWGTRHENIQDRFRNGKGRLGEQCPTAVLTPALVRDIRERVAAKESIADIAASLGVNKSTVRNAARGKYWGHVE